MADFYIFDGYGPYRDDYGSTVVVSDSDEDEESEDGGDNDNEDEESEDGGDNDNEVVEVIADPPNSGPIAVGVSETEGKKKVETEPNLTLIMEDSEKELNREDVEGSICPICMEPWTASGDHQPSCLSCGHLFGMSCIKKWLGQRRNSGKCPQCNKKCALKDVRRIYGSRVVVIDEDRQKRIQSLEVQCDSLMKKDEEWRKKEVDWRMKLLISQKKEEELYRKLQELHEKASKLERTVAELNNSRTSAATNVFQQPSARGLKSGSTYCSIPSNAFELQQELPVDGARHFDVDVTGQFFVMGRKPARIGEPHYFTKIDLSSPHEHDNVLVPSAIRAMHLSPFSKLLLLASMGRKLSVLSLESNSTSCVINYDLPVPAWSCSWDSNNSHNVYAGLQNGNLLVFDLRNTGEPLESRNGLTCNPIHTMYSVLEDSPGHAGIKKLLTASQIGVCEWSISGVSKEPSLIEETANQGVCISLAHCRSSDNIVATFRPKVEIPDDPSVSQVSQSPSYTLGNHVQGSQVVFQRANNRYEKMRSMCTAVPSIRLPKSTIIGMRDGSPVFACGDEATSDLVLRELSSLTITQRLPSYYPNRQVKCTDGSLLCCLSQEKLQVFSQKLL